MRSMNVTCVWEPSPTYYELMSDILTMNIDYWSSNYETECPTHRPLVHRMTFVDCILTVFFTAVFSLIRLHGGEILEKVSYSLIFSMTSDRILSQKYVEVFHCSTRNAMRAAEVTCRLGTRMVSIALTSYVTLILPQCSVLTMPSIHRIFFSQDYYCPWNQIVFAFGTACYCWEIIALFFVNERRKDFHLLLIHHFASIFCLFYGYSLRCYEISLLILLLHDVCDPFLEISKIAICLSQDQDGRLNYKLVRVTDVLTPMLFVTWIISRLYIFPMRGIWPAATTGRLCDFAYVYWVTMVLTLLAVLNVAWAGMIISALYNRLLLGLFTDETIEDPDPVALQEKISATEGRQKIN